ncbi:hypothetical protein HDU77_004811 [Chytriomyces hyalinus]|nr:hypothetical protein HDU77_004811 [Chytriomyces hyalinus]
MSTQSSPRTRTVSIRVRASASADDRPNRASRPDSTPVHRLASPYVLGTSVSSSVRSTASSRMSGVSVDGASAASAVSSVMSPSNRLSRSAAHTPTSATSNSASNASRLGVAISYSRGRDDVRAESLSVSYRSLGVLSMRRDRDRERSTSDSPTAPAHHSAHSAHSIHSIHSLSPALNGVDSSPHLLPESAYASDDSLTAHSPNPFVSEYTPLLQDPLLPLPSANTNHPRGHRGHSNPILAFLASLPAVALGLLLILLDSLSYGVIVFPSPSSPNSPIPTTAPQVGVQMFLVSTIIAQLTYTFTSKFHGANGSMQIEVMPFLYLIVDSVQSNMMSAGDESVNRDAVLATIMVAISLSTILTGIVFFLLARFRLGNLVQFFPRQVLIGCIGGIGWFLMLTGVEITSKIDPEMNLDVILELFEPSKLMLWGSSLGLAVILKLFQHKIKHPLFVPIFYCIVPILFYAVVFGFGIPLQTLREMGFLFNMSGDALPYYTVWTYYNGMKGIDWRAVIATLPIQFSLIFFALLHVPINIPALGVSTNQSYDMNNELYSHGLSNFFAGVFGVPQNYLVYSNSLLVMRCGGDTQIAGFLLAVGAAALWLAGGDVIRYVPTTLIGCLIFHLGIDLLLESVVDTLHMPITRLEYVTIWSIVLVMGFFGFTEGILLGICLALLVFVLEYARESVVLESFDGGLSTVRRSIDEQEFLTQNKERVYGIQLYGFLFFGVISQVERHLENAIDASFKGNTSGLEFVVVDFHLVKGIDFSALQGLQRLKQKTDACGIQLIFCGLGKHKEAIAKSGIFDAPNMDPDSDFDIYVLEFDTVQVALEHCENQLLRFMRMKKSSPLSDTDANGAAILLDIFRKHGAMMVKSDLALSQTLNGLFSDAKVAEGEVVWDIGDSAEYLIVVRTGSLVTQVRDSAKKYKIVQSFLPGSMVGEVPFFAGVKYSTRLVASTEFTGWRMTRADFQKLSISHPSFSVAFIQLCLRYASQ